jgi:hypothetical protein
MRFLGNILTNYFDSEKQISIIDINKRGDGGVDNG